MVKLTLTGTATNGADYTTVGPTVTIPAGEATLRGAGDAGERSRMRRRSETAVVTVAVDPAYTVGAPTQRRR